jgi:arylsulfatase A-like enzyme
LSTRRIGQFIGELKRQNLYDSTLIIITAKHGQSPIDPSALLRIPADNLHAGAAFRKFFRRPVLALVCRSRRRSKTTLLMWLTDQTQTAADVATLSANRGLFGGEKSSEATRFSCRSQIPPSTHAVRT